jgi:hypothetical protein
LRLDPREYSSIRDHLPQDDQAELRRMYFFQPEVKEDGLKAAPYEAEAVERQRIFIAAGAIPAANSPGAAIVDLT